MGKISDMFEKYAQGFAEGDKETIFGIPSAKGTGPGHGGTGHAPGGTGGAPGTGGPPQHLTEQQRLKLQDFFHKGYGRYPTSEYEFQQWLKHNW